MKGLTSYTVLLAQAAATFQLPPDLLEAQCFHESGGDADALRYEPVYFRRYIRGNSKALAARYRSLAACSVGLMQIMVETAYERGYLGSIEGLFDPLTNIQLGAREMRRLLDWAGGNYPKALAAYNEGQGAAMSGPPFLDQGYVDAIYALARSVPPTTAELAPPSPARPT